MDSTEAMTRAAGPDVTQDRSYIDWAAILGGAVVATAVATTFTAFGAVLGLSALSAEPGEGSFNFAIILSGIWVVVTLVASYGAGGYIAGRMRRRVDQASADEVATRDGINGLVVWGVGMLIGAVILTNATTATVSAVGAAAGTVVTAAGSAVGGAAQGMLSAAGGIIPETTDPVGFVTDTLLRPAQVDPLTATPQELTASSGAILTNVLATGEISDAERAYLESAVAAQTGLPQPQVTARVDDAVAAAQSARTQAVEMAAQAEKAAIDLAESARISAILTAFLLTAAAFVAAATSVIAAVRGGHHRDEGRMYAGLSYRIRT